MSARPIERRRVDDVLDTDEARGLIESAQKTGTLTATLKAGTVELYCSVPGHKAAGMDLKIKVS